VIKKIFTLFDRVINHYPQPKILGGHNCFKMEFKVKKMVEHTT